MEPLLRQRVVRPVDRVTADDERRSFWTGYQPGMRGPTATVGSPEFFAEAAARRYTLEPDIAEIVSFERWAGKDVLEAGCGIGHRRRPGLRARRRQVSRGRLQPSRARACAPALPELADADSWSRGSITRSPLSRRVVSTSSTRTASSTTWPRRRARSAEFHRVLRPGGAAIVMVYHRASLNFFFSIMVLRRVLARRIAAYHEPTASSRA